MIMNENKSVAWLGIPYAKAPVGELRWKAPQKAENWTEAFNNEKYFNAEKYGNVFIQVTPNSTTGSEDGLNLNVFRPNTSSTDLPVMMFIHGGNNQTSSNQAFNGYKFAAEGNCIVVSVNYRLGILGFNTLPALKTGNALEDSGNYALLDLSLALDWINENIKAFGGDPNNITIAGHSAGGRDVMAMLISPVMKGKFQKAISFSGGMTLADPNDAAKFIAKALARYAVTAKIKPDEKEAYDWLLTSGNDVKKYLYGMSAKKLASAVPKAAIRMSEFPHLYADGTVLPKEGFNTKNYNNVPLIMMTGSSEFSFFAMEDPYFLNDSNLNDCKILYDPKISAEYRFAAKYGGLLYKLFNAQEAAETMFNHYNAPIYTMEFDWGDNAGIVGEKMAGTIGSYHGIVVDFLSGDNSTARTEFPEIFETKGAQEMWCKIIKYLSNFMHTENPNGEGLEKWDAWTSATSGNTNLVVNADKENAIIKMTNERIVCEDVLKKMEADDSISSEAKQAIISRVLNGRWFSKKLDEYFKNKNLWLE